MKRKIFNILFALVLVVSFSLVTAVPVSAGEGITYFYNGYGQQPGEFCCKTIPQDASNDGEPITIIGCPWDELNGHAYLKWVSGWYYRLYEDAGLTTPKLPDLERPEYTQGQGAYMEWGHAEPPVCGNCHLEPGEECDDGNTEDGDGCSCTCTLEGPEAFGSLVYLWASPGDGSCSTADDGVCLKWYKNGQDASDYIGTAVTLSGCDWDELNGHWYIKDQATGERAKLYANFDGSSFTDPAIAAPGRSGYLSASLTGVLYEGHVDVDEPAEFGTIMRTWASANEGGGSGDEAYLKWFVAGQDAPDYNVQRVTLVDCAWDELNGQWYVNAVGPEHIKLYESYDGTTFSDPAMTDGRTGYIESMCTGYFEEGWPPPSEVWVDGDYTGYASCAADGRHWQYDAFDAIQDGIDIVASGGTINVAAATYNEDVTIDRSLTLNGARAGVDARGRTENESEIIGSIKVTPDASDVTIDGFTITGTAGGAMDGVCIRTESPSITVVNNIVNAVAVAGGYTYSGIVDLDGITNALVECNSFSGVYDQARAPNVIRLGISGAGIVTVANNEMTEVGGGGGIGIMCGNAGAVVNITGNEMNHTGDGIWTYNSAFDTLSITGNQIYHCNACHGDACQNIDTGVKLVGTINGVVVIVDNDFQDNQIQLDNSAGVVDIEQVLDANIFDRAVVIDREGGSLLHTIWSKIQDGVNAAVTGDTVDVAAGTYSESPVINVNNLTLQAGSSPVVLGGFDVQDDADNVTIDGFTIQPTSGDAVHVRTAGNVTVTGCTIVGQGPTGGVDGIVYTHSAPATAGTVTDNIISDCELGIYLDHDGLYDFTVTGNTVEDSRKGIGLGTLSGATIDDNDTSGCTQIGIEIRGSANITNNTVQNNQVGIWVGSDVEINFNNIEGNTTGVLNESTEEVDATNNWWGDASGPGGVGPGTGDEVSDNVDYDPWLGAGVEDSKSQETETGEVTVDAKDEADTEVVKTGTGTPTITVAEYSSNPGTGFSGDIGKYVDVHIDDPTGVTEIVIKVYYTNADIAGRVESSLRLRWWNGTSWVACSDFGVNTTDIAVPLVYSGYMWAKVRSDTVPKLTELSGTAFSGHGGTAPPPPPPPVTLESIAASPSSLTLDVDETQQLTVTATYSDASTADVTAEASYESSDTSVTTVSDAGLITGVAEGSAAITVSYTEDEIEATDTVSVTVIAFTPWSYDADGDGVIDKDEALTAVADYFDDVITKDQALEVIVEYMG